jgi:hypothetical protein
MPKFRKRPVEIEAVQFDGSSTCKAAIRRWMEGFEFVTATVQTRDLSDFVIQTPEGDMYASPGDWIIRGVQGEFYPCKPDIFEATYEPVG